MEKYGKKRIIIPGILAIIAIIFGIHYFWYASTHISTDDAYVEAHIVRIAPKASGNILKVLIDDNQKVKEGQLLAEIDPADYQVKYDQAAAKLQSAEAKFNGATTNVELTSKTSNSLSGQAKAALEQVNHDVTAAEVQVKYTHADFDRYTKLYEKGAVSKQDYDKAVTADKVAREKLSAAHKACDQATEKTKGTNTVTEQVSISDSAKKQALAEIKQLKAAAKQAELDLAYTKIYAPQDGLITSKSVEQGGYVQVGQPLLAIVPDERWIIANFKETEVANMKIGQNVDIKVDAYPNRVFHGKVDSIQASTGAKTSLFPPENAVGSFVKVVQRVPVKIVFTDKIDSRYNIVPGMSVIPEVCIK